MVLNIFPVLFLLSVLSSSLILSYTSQGLLSKVSADPLDISNDPMKDAYLIYVKLKINQGQGQGGPPNGCHPGLGQLDKKTWRVILPFATLDLKT